MTEDVGPYNLHGSKKCANANNNYNEALIN